MPGVRPSLPLALAATLLMATPATAEFGDVVLNQTSTAAGMPPVIFPHWFHRIRFRCVVCHTELGFKMGAGSNQITMKDVNDGKFCGVCHNDKIAWGVLNCPLCHSGKPGLPTRVFGRSTVSGPGKW